MPHSGIGPSEIGEEKYVVDRRQKSFSIRQSQQAQKSAGTRDPLKAGALIHIKKPRQDFDSLGVREQVAEYEIPRQSRKKWPLVMLVDLRARCFDELAIFHARR